MSSALSQEWEYLDSGITNDLNSISCPNERTCYAAGGAPIIGGPGVIIKTINGGDTWDSQPLPTTSALRSIKCVDAETCYASGDGIILKKTATTSWNIVNRSGQTLWDIYATSPLYAVAVGNLGTRLRTTNGGATWTGYIPPRTGTFQSTLLAVFFIDDMHGWTVGYEGVMRYTDNGGATWTNLDSGETLGLSDIFTFDGEILWTCGSFSHISKSTDSASSWTDYSIPSLGGCSAIEFANLTFGWLFGNGAILHSDNGGETWEMVSGLQTIVFFRDIECFGPDLCYGVGDDGVVIKYGESPTEATQEPEEEPQEPAIDSNIPPANPACPAITDDCEAGWYPVFEYNSIGCAINYTCMQEGFKIDKEVLAQLISQIPGLSKNEYINIYVTKNDGSKNIWGIIIKNKEIEITSSEIKNPTFNAETKMSTIKTILSSSDPINAALTSIKNKEIDIKSKTLKGRIKTLGIRIFLLFKGPKETKRIKFLDEDADTEKNFIEPSSLEREEFLRIALNISRNCNPENTKLSFGSMDWEAGRLQNTTIVAPHGTYDYNTDSLLLKITARYPANYVIARNYETDEIRINVNRPSEKLDNGTEIQTARATRVYNVFKNCVDQYRQKYYIEIHGNSDENTENEIEVATVNVSPALANYLVSRFNVHKRGKLDGYTLSIEPLDGLVWTARQNKQIGMLSHCDNICLHFETPYAMREESGDVSKTAEVLSELFMDLENYPPKKI